MNDSLFAQALQCKLRFETNKGLVTVEDLWDLPLESSTNTSSIIVLDSLDSIAVNLDEKIKQSSNKSFVNKKKDKDKILSLKFDIVKYVIDTKIEQLDKENERTEKMNKLNKIMEIIEKKQDQELEEMSKKELQKIMKDIKSDL